MSAPALHPTDKACAEVMTLLQQVATVGYIGEPVSQLAHALQCADWARRHHADDMLVVAALLHDIGHLCAGLHAPTMDDLGVAGHELVGARFLQSLGFHPVVCQLVAGHVEAKRYLTYQNAGYYERLSDASKRTLVHQGGPFDAAQAHAFISDPQGKDKLRLRAWDEAAKDPRWQGPALDSYIPLIRRSLAPQSA